MVDIVTSWKDGGQVLPDFWENAARSNPYVGSVVIPVYESSASVVRYAAGGDKPTFTLGSGLFGDSEYDSGSGEIGITPRNPATGNEGERINVGDVNDTLRNSRGILENPLSVVGITPPNVDPNNDSGLKLITAVIQNLDKIAIGIGLLFLLQLLNPVIDLLD